MKTNPADDKSDTVTIAATLSDDSVDRLLHAHLAAPAEQPMPSSGFVLSVMDAIQQQAAEPPLIAFPWRRVLPGVIAIVCALTAFVLFVPSMSSAGPVFAAGLRAHLLLSSSAFTYGEVVLGSVLLAALVSVAAVAASFRLAGSSR